MISFFMSFPLKVNLRSPLATIPIRWHEILKRETFSWSFSSSWRCHLEMLKHYQRRDFIKYLTSLRRPPWTQDKTARAMNANELILLPSISNWVAHAASRPEFFIIPRRKADLRLIKKTQIGGKQILLVSISIRRHRKRGINFLSAFPLCSSLISSSSRTTRTVEQKNVRLPDQWLKSFFTPLALVSLILIRSKRTKMWRKRNRNPKIWIHETHQKRC